MKDTITTTLRWTGDWPWWAAVAVALVLGITAALLYRRDVAGNSRWLRILLPALRALAVVMIVLMLAGPVLHHRRVTGTLARLVIAVDGSESMQLTDSALDASRKIALARRLGILEGVATPLEIPQAAELLANARSATLGLAALDSPDAALLEKTRAALAEKVAAALDLVSRSNAEAEVKNRITAELGEPVKRLATAALNAVDDRTRATADISRMGDLAGRWSRDLAANFEKQLDSNPAAAPLRAALAKLDTMPRWSRLQSLLMEGAPEKQLLRTLATQHDVQFVLLENGEVKTLWRPGDPKLGELPTTLPKPGGEITNLTSALKFAAGDERTAEKGAVILLTDGQHNSGDAPLDAARVLGARSWPVYSVGFGSVVPPRDLAVLRVVAPDAVFHEDRIRGEVLLKEEVPPGQPFTISVRDGDKVVWEKQIVTEGRALRKVPFEFPVKELAEARLKAQAGAGYEVLGAPLDLTASVSGLEGDRELSNNAAPLRFRAVTQKRRILLLDGRPRWETRYLNNTFERDEKWEVSMVIAGGTGEQGFIRGDKPGNFPNEQKLVEAFDLIIFGEVPRKHFKDDELRWIAEFVEKRGGAILFLDGQRGELRGYGDTPLGPLMPVEWTGPGIRTGMKSLAPSERASGVGAFAMSTDLAANTDTWARLPVPHWLASVKPLPGSEIYLEADLGAQKAPAALMRPFGAGRVYFQAFDDSWRWRYEVADQYHVKFWNQLASFVAEPPFAARDKFAALDAGALTYQPGDSADVRVRLRDGEGRPVTDAAVSAVLKRDGQRVATIPLSPDSGGLYRGKTAALDPGAYEVSIESAVVPEGQLKARTEFKVTARESAERTVLSVNEDLLRQVSTAGGGEYLREEQCDDLIAKLKPLSDGRIEERDTVLWQDWSWFALIVALLTVEWVIRKRSGML